MKTIVNDPAVRISCRAKNSVEAPGMAQITCFLIACPADPLQRKSYSAFSSAISRCMRFFTTLAQTFILRYFF
ncbi:hypothetical protein KCP77_06225 [Salmonella enterica subsp. enterica]|nr:hypothetical protein KCP77_06225 [Salmonella enterica subsp. enterica]